MKKKKKRQSNSICYHFWLNFCCCRCYLVNTQKICTRSFFAQQWKWGQQEAIILSQGRISLKYQTHNRFIAKKMQMKSNSKYTVIELQYSVLHSENDAFSCFGTFSKINSSIDFLHVEEHDEVVGCKPFQWRKPDSVP